MTPEISSVLRRGAGAKAGAVPGLGHCSAGVRAECLMGTHPGDSAQPSSINKADNTCLLHGAGEIKHNRRHFYSLETTQVPQRQITFDKHLM